MNHTILLVEDNESDEKLTLLAFQKCGLGDRIVVVRDGAAALEYLFATGAHAGRDPALLPHLILLDLKLPKIDGLEVLRRLRADPRTHLVPVVVLTASREEEDVIRSYELGANAYVRKQVEFEAFLETARLLGSFWLHVNERAPVARGLA